MKVKRIVAVAFSVALLVALLCTPVFATTTGWSLTPMIRTGVEWSGLSAGDVTDMALSIDSITGDDVDVEFFNTGIGLSDYFIWSTSRTAKITVKDDDPGDNVNEELFDRTATFGMVNGVYRPVSYGARRNVNESEIEDNNILELYLLITISKVTGDGADWADAGLIRYRFTSTY